jgi:hypothetical protein
MGWELRKGRYFYYRKQRQTSGRVRSIYLGRGDKAIEASRADGVAVPDEVLGSLAPEPVAQPLIDEQKTSQNLALPRARVAQSPIK